MRRCRTCGRRCRGYKFCARCLRERTRARSRIGCLRASRAATTFAPVEPPPLTYPPNRRCETCRCRLSAYNPTTRCLPCQRRRVDQLLGRAP